MPCYDARIMAKKQEETEVQDEALMDGDLAGQAETRVYELGFHLDPELPIEEVKKSYGAIRRRGRAPNDPTCLHYFSSGDFWPSRL